jgi:YaaC-like Protein
MISVVRLNGRDVNMHKATVTPVWKARTVLTNSPWDFVTLWLKREKKGKALFYWSQAREFANASTGMPVQSSPLLHYYTFMNAAKALLVAKGILFDEMHGVRAHNIRGTSKKITLSNEGVKIMQKGILPSLSSYLGECEISSIHSLEELLFNLPFIHRTYCLTYRNQSDLFIPLTDCCYAFDSTTNQAYFKANLSSNFADARFIKRLPSVLIADPNGLDIRAIRSTESVTITDHRLKFPADIANIELLHKKIRADLQYINGAQTLWYAKAIVTGPTRLERSPLTLTLAAMHRLSEICRYRPIELSAFLDGQKNWLLSEFIQMAPGQFLDEIASEITGYQFMIPNVRAAT